MEFVRKGKASKDPEKWQEFEAEMREYNIPEWYIGSCKKIILSKVGGYDIAGLAGMFLGGAIYRVPVLMDGFISSVAALTAVKLCPQVQDFLLASHVSKEPAGQMLLHALSCRPMLTCDMGLGEGTGAVAALPILDLALTVYHQASTFSQIQMQAYEPLE